MTFSDPYKSTAAIALSFIESSLKKIVFKEKYDFET